MFSALPSVLRRSLNHYDPHLSVSQVQTALSCPRKWAFQYTEGVEVERASTPSLRNGIDLDNYLNAYYLRQQLPVIGEEAQKAADLVLAEFGTLRMKAVQKRHHFEFQGLPVFGYSDAIDERNVYIDHKYKSRAGDAKWIRKVQKQIATYWIADNWLRWETGDGHGRIVEVRHNHLTVHAFPIDVELCHEAIRDLAHGALVVRAKTHIPTPGPDCSWCDYQFNCRAWLKAHYGQAE